MQNRETKNCLFNLPENADYCPECGGQASDHSGAPPHAPVNVRTLGALIEASTLGDLDDEETADTLLDTQAAQTRRRRGIAAWSACALAVAVTLAVSGFMVGGDTAPIPAEPPSAATETDAPTPPRKAELGHATLDFDDDRVNVVVKAKSVVTLLTASGSRYSTLEERAESIQIRLNHVVDQLAHDDHSSVFIARASSDAFVVLWRRSDDSTFRIMDITPLDVEKWRQRNGETNASILANAIVDELNATFGTDALPDS